MPDSPIPDRRLEGESKRTAGYLHAVDAGLLVLVILVGVGLIQVAL